MPTKQLIPYIDKLIEGLLDIETHCSSAACIFLVNCIKLKGGDLSDHVIIYLISLVFSTTTTTTTTKNFFLRLIVYSEICTLN
jgi:hypothetical protein